MNPYIDEDLCALAEHARRFATGRVAAGVIHEEIARADLSISYINLLASLNGQILSQHGQPEVVRPWLAKLTQGQALLAIALTEPRGGSDAANLRLRVERVTLRCRRAPTACASDPAWRLRARARRKRHELFGRRAEAFGIPG